jgi:hypothetical protein
MKIRGANPGALIQIDLIPPFSCAFCRSLLAGDPKRWTGLSFKHRLQAGSYIPNKPKIIAGYQIQSP